MLGREFMKEKQIIITFSSTTDAMLFEMEAKKNNICGRLIPTPTTITAECGLSYKAPLSEKKQVLEVCSMLAFTNYNVYEVEM